jgi:hypothetical protein
MELAATTPESSEVKQKLCSWRWLSAYADVMIEVLKKTAPAISAVTTTTAVLVTKTEDLAYIYSHSCQKSNSLTLRYQKENSWRLTPSVMPGSVNEVLTQA